MIRRLILCLPLFILSFSCEKREKSIMDYLLEGNNISDKKYGHTLNLDYPIIENGFDLEFNFYYKKVLGETTTYSLAVKDSVFAELDWDEKDFAQARNDRLEIETKPIESYKFNNEENKLIFVSKRDESIFFVQIIYFENTVNDLRGKTYDDILNGNLVEVSHMLALIYIVKNNTVVNVYVEDGGIG
ncbi:hypothetical protein GZ212_05785 [Mangrovimonas sp. CR14]|uniref:hypothetical protein n=1 Tax=Mangrovimonas sp. CR14 TaxID=2706120 RepID=UPI0014242956|nr:hypothetical protein [Mangrovimonas sp. CR14]NIK91656.1 hypothetical protein [Mangrovimonas sp. CR14]